MDSHKLVIGLTGGIASGKSQISRYFQELGVEIIDSDQIARELFTPGSQHLLPLKARYGDVIFDADNALNRKELGRIVFSNQAELAWLNQYTHPLINKQMRSQLTASRSAYVILDVPLLINQQGIVPDYLKEMIDRILVIDISPELQLKRVQARDNISEVEANKIFATQSSLEQKLTLADDIIDNNGTLESLKKQVVALHSFYLTLTHSNSDKQK